MPGHTMLFAGTLALVALTCAVLIVSRLRQHSVERADADRRAAIAFEEMTRLTRELRTRQHGDPTPDPSLSPGERLMRRYPGSAGRTTSAPEDAT